MEEALSSLDCFPCRCSRKVPESIQGLECRGSHVGMFGVMDEESRSSAGKAAGAGRQKEAAERPNKDSFLSRKSARG